jgi:hypothetical protein
MERAYRLAAASGLLIVVVAVSVAACHQDGCDYYGMTCIGDAGGTGAAGGAGGAGGAGAGGGDTGAPTNCDPMGMMDLADDACGVFVSSNAMGMGHGTPKDPYKTLADALADIAAHIGSKPGRKHIYACNVGPFEEAVMLTSDVVLHGALDCTNFLWKYEEANRTMLTAPADTIPLTLMPSATGAAINDFWITAPDAKQAGGSSIAVVVGGGTASFERCDLSAGNAMGGSDGAFTSAQAMDADSGKVGADAGATGDGGAGATNIYCGRMGGNGGNGGTTPSGNGLNGSPGDPGGNMTPYMGGSGGLGDSSTPGEAGMDGLPGKDGAGAGPAGSDALSMSGYAGVNGQDATAGIYGTSGGGGGGSAASAMVVGAGGGGGGAGGCGGVAGQGGMAGGSSIALVSVNATVTMTGCKLVAGNGGNGGKGSIGQPGQTGGSGASGGKGGTGVGMGAFGGAGGNGGNGGNGGGGLGGYSVAIAATGMPPQVDGTTTCQSGANGDGGSGGSMTNSGATGEAVACWDFDMKLPCTGVDCS